MAQIQGWDLLEIKKEGAREKGRGEEGEEDREGER